MTQKTVHIAALETLADWEIGYLTAHLRNGHFQTGLDTYEIRFVGASPQSVTTMGGIKLTPDIVLDDLAPEASVALVLPGADTWDEPENQGFVDAACDFLSAGRPVAAICGATFALAAAGVLDNRPHTSNDLAYLESSGYAGNKHYVNDSAVIDGDLITASGVAPAHFARALFERLGAYPQGVLESWVKLYGDRDPAAFYELMSS